MALTPINLKYGLRIPGHHQKGVLRMEFNEYQRLAIRTAVYPCIGRNYVYPTLGLAGEAGEVAERVKKIFRDSNGEMTAEQKELLVKELGDVLWYVSALAHELYIDLDEVAQQNLRKLHDRKERNMIHGSGDKR
jgi:NTP pyrophosphatase (non-canonical NTP hydrolase)